MNYHLSLQMGSAIARARSSWKRLFGRPKKLPAAVPAGLRVYAVGDIHGRLDLLTQLWSMIESDAAESDLHKLVIFLGDYVDRGPDPRGVIDFLLSARLTSGEVICLRGNHDQSVLDFLADAEHYRAWKQFGAASTLMSYGVQPPRFDDAKSFKAAHRDFLGKLPQSHFDFLDRLSHSHDVGGYMFVHAGVRPGVPLDRQEHKDLMWIREEFLASRQSYEKVVVHGHSPQDAPVKLENRIGVDTGAYFTGNLTTVVLEGETCRFIST